MNEVGIVPPETETKLATSEPPSLCAHAAAITTQRLTRLLSYAEGVRQGQETAPVHDMRVWSRQTRAALEVFACCFGGREFREIEREIKAVADALGEARDLDVMIELLVKRAEDLPPPQRPGLDVFIAGLRERRADAQTRVQKAVGRLERRDLVPRFEALAAHPARKAHKAEGKKRHG